MLVALSFLLPCAVFVHSVWRIFTAGGRHSKLLAFTPTVSFAFAALWLTRTLLAHLNGGMTPELAKATTSVGPLLAAALCLMAEMPFIVQGLQLRRAAKRSAKAKGAL